MPRSSLTFFCLNHHQKAHFASKKIYCISYAVIFLQVEEWVQGHFQEQSSLPLSHNQSTLCRLWSHQCFVAALQLPTGVLLPQGSGLLLRHDLRLGARRGRGRRVQRQLAQSQIALESTTLRLALPQVLPCLQETRKSSFFSFVFLILLFWRSGQCQRLDTFLSLAGIPAA